MSTKGYSHLDGSSAQIVSFDENGLVFSDDRRRIYPPLWGRWRPGSVDEAQRRYDSYSNALAEMFAPGDEKWIREVKGKGF